METRLAFGQKPIDYCRPSSLDPRPGVGWINSLSPNVGTIETLPHGWSWLSPGGKCPTFIHEGGLPSLDNPAHVAAYTRLMESVQWKTDRPIGNPPYLRLLATSLR